jgi:hypothetical protein
MHEVLREGHQDWAVALCIFMDRHKTFECVFPWNLEILLY